MTKEQAYQNWLDGEEDTENTKESFDEYLCDVRTREEGLPEEYQQVPKNWI